MLLGRIPARAVKTLVEILSEAYAAGVVQYEHNDPRPPEVTETRVRFNGIGKLGHDTFVFDTGQVNRRPDGFRFDCCMTERQPYDELVMKVLIVLKYSLGDALKVTSDGRFDTEWAAVRAEMATRYDMATVAEEQLLVVPRRVA